MWVITLYSKEAIKMFEFDTENEAVEAYKNMTGHAVLSHVIYYNDPCFAS